ncbi:MAG: hypothetical protein JSW59_13775 [Phycisphaerales bacterium]|nr:MAG: hypothetical protein JSW59_13775 [Phycisphaerales bacterium]
MVDQNVEGETPRNHGQASPEHSRRDAGDAEVQVPAIAKTRLVRSRRQIYLQIVAATVILICGIIIGSGAALLRFKENIAPGPMPPPGRIADDMQERYGLTEEQTEKVKDVVRQSSERMRKLFEDFRPKMEAEFRQFSAAMKDTLTSEQFRQWERDFKSRRGRRPRRFGPGGPGPGGRPGGFRGPGPGGRPGGPGPDGKLRQGRHDRPGFRPGPRGPAEPNAPEE